MSLKLVVLGLPGAGKGTQAKKLASRYGIPHISMGDILRNNKDYVTDSGKTVGEIIDGGNPVTAKTAGDLLAKRLDRPDCAEGYVLDGFPRYLEQAEVMEDITEVDAILLIEVTEDNIYERLTKRRICPECGDQYHLHYDPPEEDEQCDDCETRLIQREDDTREGIGKRIEWQREGMEEVLDFYDGSGLIEHVDGNPSISEVWEAIQEVADRYV